MGKFVVRDKHIAFLNDIVAGMPAYKSYIKHISPTPHVKKTGASVRATELMKRPLMQAELAKIQQARSQVITDIKVREVAEVFKSTVLEPDELDAFNSAIIQGTVDVEELVVQWTVDERIDPNTGKVVGRRRTQNLVKVKRQPNIRERQASMDMLYKRRGSYIHKHLGLIKRADDDTDGNGEENTTRVVVLSTGEKIDMFGEMSFK